MSVCAVQWLKSLGTTPQGTLKGPLRGPLYFDVALPGSLHQWDRRHPMCVLMGCRCHRLPILSLMEKVPSLAQSLES